MRKSNDKLERLVSVRNRVMHSRPMSFEDYPNVIETSRHLLSFKGTQFANLKYWYEQIRKEPTSVLNLEIKGRYPDEENSILHNLPVPDFDDTGFLGRSEQMQELKALIYSNWPVITIVGEGGIGKTALAVKLAYDILDDPSSPFDAIIWSSSKTTALSQNDVIEIDNAIRDSIGLFNYIDEQLDPSVGNPVDNIVDYINTFNILLILDNLETVLDDKIRNFIARIRSNSKVLITSRIGLGELETRYQLDPLTDKESVTLLRATAKSRRMTSLANASQKQLAEYCNQMYGNPAFIKWFVSAVQSGKRPEKIIARPDHILQFCMSNVIEYLSADAKALMEIFLIYPGSHTPPVLAHLADLSSEVLQRPLQQLLTTNVLKLRIVNSEDRAIASYEIADLPRAYLIKEYKPSPDRAKIIIKRRRELVQAQELYSSDKANRYVLQTITLRSRDDAVAARLLTRGLRATAKSDWEDAKKNIEQAQGLAPDFYETYRVEAFLNALMGNYPRAQQCYLLALDLEPRSAPLRYWYGGFLLRYMDDTEGAEDQLRIAHELDDTSLEVLNELSRSLTYQHKYEEAEQFSLLVLRGKKRTTKAARIAYDGLVQICSRSAQFALSNRDYEAALHCAAKLKELVESIPEQIIDQKVLSSAERILVSRQHLRNAYEGTNREGQVDDVFDGIEDLLSSIATRTGVSVTSSGLRANSLQTEYSSDVLLNGSIKAIKRESNFGFIFGNDGIEYFFHRGSLENSAEFNYLQEGDFVRFCPSSGQKGPVAIQVLVSSPTSVVESIEAGAVQSEDNLRRGHIGLLVEDKGYCFIEEAEGKRYFAHVSEFESPGAMTQSYERKALLSFSVGVDNTGRPRAVGVRAIDSSGDKVEWEAGTVYSGTVKMREAASGFVQCDDLGDVFFHKKDFVDWAEWEICFDGSDVEFEVKRGSNKDGLRACRVRLTSRV